MKQHAHGYALVCDVGKEFYWGYNYAFTEPEAKAAFMAQDDRIKYENIRAEKVKCSDFIDFLYSIPREARNAIFEFAGYTPECFRED